MKLELINELPTPAAEPADWLILQCFTEQDLNLLVYAIKRDFLSTPRTFALLELFPSAELRVNYTIFPAVSYAEDSGLDRQAMADGFYRPPDTEGLVLLFLDDKVVELECQEIELRKHLYHFADARAALADHLNTGSAVNPAAS